MVGRVAARKPAPMFALGRPPWLHAPCWLCSAAAAALAGGASFSLHSLQAAALGAAAAVPLVLYKKGSWLPETQANNAALSALRKAQTENAKPWLHGMDSFQLGAHLVMDTLPPLFLMLPAAQAGLNSSFAFTRAALGNSTGLNLPEEVGFMLALLMTGLVTAAVRSSDFMTDPAQVGVVSDAVANADRCVGMGRGGHAHVVLGTCAWVADSKQVAASVGLPVPDLRIPCMLQESWRQLLPSECAAVFVHAHWD